jgi:hypothetical protein
VALAEGPPKDFAERRVLVVLAKSNSSSNTKTKTNSKSFLIREKTLKALAAFLASPFRMAGTRRGVPTILLDTAVVVIDGMTPLSILQNQPSYPASR